MQTCIKRLNKERLDADLNNNDIIELKYSLENLRLWTAIVKGPPGSFYEGYKFELLIDCPFEYPMIPPKIKFKTKIFHPNVLFDTGEICLDILKKEWTPAWSLHSACTAIIMLLEEPAAESPLNCDAGNILRAGDMRAYRSLVTMYCKEYCKL